MIRCTECGHKTITRNTYNSIKGDLIIRRRVCENCGEVIITQETIKTKGEENLNRE